MSMAGGVTMSEGGAFGSGGSPASDGGRKLRDVGGWLARVHLRLPVSVFGKKREHLLDSDSRLLPRADYVERLRWYPVDHNHAYDHLWDRWSAWAELIFAGVMSVVIVGLFGQAVGASDTVLFALVAGALAGVGMTGTVPMLVAGVRLLLLHFLDEKAFPPELPEYDAFGEPVPHASAEDRHSPLARKLCVPSNGEVWVGVIVGLVVGLLFAAGLMPDEVLQ